jgi:hypothetical protein
MNSDLTTFEVGAIFERRVAEKYEAAGWRVWLRGIERKGGDLGIDLVATRDSRQVLVQCKYWSQGREIGVDVVRVFARDCAAYIARRGCKEQHTLGLVESFTYGKAIVATCGFTPEAEALAEIESITLRSHVTELRQRVQFATTASGYPNKEPEPPENVPFDHIQIPEETVQKCADDESLNCWLDSLEHQSKMARARRASEMPLPALGVVILWCFAAGTIGGAWGGVIAAIPLIVMCYAWLNAGQMTRTDEDVQRMLNELNTAHRLAQIAEDEENRQFHNRNSHAIKMDIQRRFLTG